MIHARDILARFRDHTVLMESGCVEWRGPLHRDGYGKFSLNNRTVSAHRAAYLLQAGDIPDGKWVLHTCDNRKCVSIDHLYIGDAKQNSRDRSVRLRYATRKIPPHAVPTIRSRYAAGGVSQQSLADEYGVHQTQISKIVLGKQRLAK